MSDEQQSIQRPFRIPIVESKQIPIDNLKFNTLMLPFIIRQQGDQESLIGVGNQSNLQPCIIPRELKIEELPYRKQNTYIDIQYLTGDIIKKTKYKIQFNLTTPIQQISYNCKNKQLVPFNDNVSLMEFITNSVCRSEDIDVQKNKTLCEDTKRALRLISIINNNFAEYKVSEQNESEFTKNSEECVYGIQIVSEYI